MEKLKKLIFKYFTAVKYIFSSGVAFFIDLTIFTILELIFKNIIIATILARITSSFINYLLNSKLVFNFDKENNKSKYQSLIEYFLLVVMQMLISAYIVDKLYLLFNINPTIIKIPVEVILFMINYCMQKFIIFNKNRQNNSIIKSLLLSSISVIALLGNTPILKLTSLNEILLNPKYLEFFHYSSYIEVFKHINIILYIIFFIFFYFLYNNINLKLKINKIYEFIAILISFVLVVCASYNHVSNMMFLYSSVGNIIISLIKFIGFYFIIRSIITYADKFLHSDSKKNKDNNKIIILFKKNPFIFSAIFLFFCYSIYLIAFYPGIINFDNANQIKEVMGIHTRYLDSIIPLSSSSFLTNFNPIVHTLLLGNLFKLGHYLQNDNLGLFLYIIIQLTTVIFTISYVIKYLRKEEVNIKLLLVILLLFGIVPVFPFYAITAVKDVFYMCFILLYSLKLYDILKYSPKLKDYIILFMLALLVILFRNNGYYAVLLSLPFLLFINKKLPVVILIIAVIGVNNVFEKVILPYFDVSSTSIREALSIPFQQTARYVKYYEKDLTNHDKKVIDKLLDYDNIKRKYDEDIADPVKNKFNRYYKKEDLTAYFDVWAKGLKKRPMVYLDATINNVSGYVDPFSHTWVIYYKLNPKLNEVGFDYHYNQLDILRTSLINYEFAFEYIPLLNIFTNIGLITWINIFLCAALCAYKKYKYLIFMVPGLVQILVCFASPCNSYFRYIYPSLCMGLLFIPLIKKIIQTKD